MLWNGRVQGALFVSMGDGEHDVETFENLILSQARLCARVARWCCSSDCIPHVTALQTFVGDWGEELLEGRVDVADFFD